MAVVLRSLRRRTRLAASVLTVAITLLLFATCLSGVEMTPEQKACCAAMAHDCGEMAFEKSCCIGEGPNDDGLVAVKATFAAFPPAIVVAVLDMPATPFVATSRVARAEPSTLRPPGIPTYLFVSSFRL